MPALQLYNSLTKEIEAFTPHEQGKVSLYHCGPTVYKRQHIGNMRRFLFADLLRRTLELWGYEVREITNITDVGHLTQDEIDEGEDKIAKAATAQKVTPQMIAEEQIKLFMSDLKTLNIQPSHKYPRATQHIEQMQQMITQLLARDHAYQTATGIYFDITSFEHYGQLSGNTLEQLSAGKRIAVRTEKKHAADFALWVFDAKSLQHWDSPWGVGYPGWHIECSAMSLAYLASPIDIHTGGEDNRFPHHENEIAQSEAATSQQFVRFWMHNRHLQIQGQKMAKSGGEQITLDTIMEKGFHPLSLRLLVLGAHYRNPMDFSWELLQGAQNHLTALQNTLRRLHATKETSSDEKNQTDEQIVQEFNTALADDLNTPKAIAVLLKYIRQINSQLDQPSSSETFITALPTLYHLDQVLGIIEPLEISLADEQIPADIQALAKKREEARTGRSFEEADRLRQLIEKQGFTVEDTTSGPRIIKKNL